MNPLVRLILGLALSLALVGGLVLSLLQGAGTPRAQTATSSAQKEFFGIAQGARFDTRDLRTIAAAGVRTDRFLLNWAWVEPSPGSFRWPDQLVGALASHGIRPVPFVWGSPRWLVGVPERPPVGSARAEHAWRDFLQAVVERYGPGGNYWTDLYRQQFGPNATPRPIQSWQVWNEPNLKKYFDAGHTVGQGTQTYARLLQISHDAIKGQDPQAQIVLAGMTGYGDVTAWKFLDRLYRIPGMKGDFDVAALNPYASNLAQLRAAVERFRAVMRKNGDQGTPLWITELGWGSAPPDRFRLNQGPTGQAQRLTDSFKLIWSHRRAWNLERLFWFDWRDPGRSEQAGTCSFCRSAGLLRHNRDPKPAYYAFKRFTGAR